MTSDILLQTLSLIFGLVLTTANEDHIANEAGTDFEVTLKTKYFVDKSLLLKEILKSPSNLLITAPTGWGKSTNLQMIKRFLELQVDEEGRTLTAATRKRHLVNDTSNYRLCMRNSLKIAQNRVLMARHFGKYPVIHADFECKHKIRNSEFSVTCFREVIHEAVAQHGYLNRSEKLTMKEKRFVEKWSDASGKYEELYGQDVTKALHKLAIILNKQYAGRRIFLLIDNYDHPPSDAMIRVKDGKELNRVLKFNLNIIATTLNSGNKYRCKAVILGKSYIAAAGIYKFDDTQSCRFLGNHTLQKYFGLSKDEVETLLMNADPKPNKNDIDLFHAFHGGFVSLRGDHVTSYTQVFNYLETRTFKINAHRKSDFMRYLKLFCKVNFMRRKIELLAKGNVIAMDGNDVYTINDLINLRDILVKDKSEDKVPEDILFYFLIEQGYLTSVLQIENKNSSVLYCKLPNLEIKYMVGQKLKKYYDEIYLPDRALLTKCVNFFKSTSPSLFMNPVQFKRAIYWFYTSFEKLIKLRWSRFKEKYIYRLLFSVVYHLEYKNLKGNFVTVSEAQGQFTCLVVEKKIVFSIGLKVNETSINVLENLFRNPPSSYFNSVPSLRKKKHIFIGLGVDSDLRLSISCRPQGNCTKNEVHIP